MTDSRKIADLLVQYLDLSLENVEDLFHWPI